VYDPLCSYLIVEFCHGDWQIGPGIQIGVGDRRLNTHQLRPEGPWYRRLIVFCEEIVHAIQVKVFGVYEESIHIEDTGSNGWKACV